MMSRMQANDYMGVLPESGNTIYIMYRVGGGEESNIARDTLTNIVYINYTICGNSSDPDNAKKMKDVQNSISVTIIIQRYSKFPQDMVAHSGLVLLKKITRLLFIRLD